MQVLEAAGGQVVEDAHGPAEGEEALDEVGADEAGAACDQAGRRGLAAHGEPPSRAGPHRGDWGLKGRGR
jgi:hypothetical protein